MLTMQAIKSYNMEYSVFLNFSYKCEYMSSNL